MSENRFSLKLYPNYFNTQKFISARFSRQFARYSDDDIPKRDRFSEPWHCQLGDEAASSPVSHHTDTAIQSTHRHNVCYTHQVSVSVFAFENFVL